MNKDLNFFFKIPNIKIQHPGKQPRSENVVSNKITKSESGS